MSRRIVTTRLQANEQDPLDNYWSRIVKYVPGEIVAAWLAVTALLAGQSTARLTLLWIVFGILLLLTPVSVLRTTNVSGMPPARTQAALSAIAFAVWAFAIGKPFSHYSFYDFTYGGVAIILFTVLSGLVVPEKLDQRARSQQKSKSTTLAGQDKP
jgi:hypothetical protein